MKISVSIPGTSHVDGLSSYTLYQVEVKVEDASNYSKWTVSVRYSEFFDLHNYVQKTIKSAKGYEFPEKKVFGRFENDVVEYRRNILEKWLQLCLDNSEVLKADRFQAFLKLSHLKSAILSGASSSSAASMTTSAADASRVSIPGAATAQDNAEVRKTIRVPPPPEGGVDMKAIYAYDDGTISCKAGDIVRVVEKEGSWWGGYVNGKYGEFPANYLGQLSDAPAAVESALPLTPEANPDYVEGLEAVAMYDYEPTDSSSQQIAFKFGDIIDLHSAHQEGDWWYGSVRGSNGVWGYFPRDYVRVLKADDFIQNAEGQLVYRDDITNYTYDPQDGIYQYNEDLGPRKSATLIEDELKQQKKDNRMSIRPDRKAPRPGHLSVRPNKIAPLPPQ